MSRKLPNLDTLTHAQLIISGMETAKVQQVRDFCTVLLHQRQPKATRTRTPKPARQADGLPI